MPDNRRYKSYGEEPVTLILKVGKNDQTGCSFLIGRQTRGRFQDVFDNIARHEDSDFRTVSYGARILLPEADPDTINLLLRILDDNRSKVQLSESMPEKSLFRLARVCQMYNCAEKIRSKVDWTTGPTFADETERSASCLPEEIYFIGKEFHLPKVLLIGWTRFVNRLYVEEGGFRGPLKIHSKRWRGLESRDLTTDGRDPLWELLEDDTQGKTCRKPEKNLIIIDPVDVEYVFSVATTRLLQLHKSTRSMANVTTRSPCNVLPPRRGLNECQRLRIRGIRELCKKLHIDTWESVDGEEYLHLNLASISVELKAAALIRGSRFELNAQHARCMQPRQLLFPVLEKLLQSVPGASPKLMERLMSLGDNRFKGHYW